MCNFVGGSYEEQFSEIIMNLGHWVRCCLKDFFSGAWRPSCSVERNRLCNFEGGHHRSDKDRSQ